MAVSRRRHLRRCRATVEAWLCLGTLALLLRAVGAQPNAGCPRLSEVYVAPSGAAGNGTRCCGQRPTPCSSIATAVDTISPTASILLLPGSHSLPPAPLNLGGKSLTIKAAIKPARATIDCGNSQCVTAICGQGASEVACEQAVLDLQDVDVMNGVSETSGGCLEVQNQRLSLSSATFSNCRAVEYGGAVAVSNSPELVVSGVNIQQGILSGATGGGGGMAINKVASASLSLLSISRCAANESSGGALLILESSAVIVDSSFESSTARFVGGAISSAFSKVLMRTSMASQSQGGSGGCFADKNSSIEIRKSAFMYCNAMSVYSVPPYDADVSYGGALYFSSSTSVLIAGTLVDTAVAAQDGGGILAESVGQLTFVSSNISNALTYSFGGGLAVRGGPLVMRDCRVANNGNYFYNALGGGIYLEAAPATIVRTTVSMNNASMYADAGVTPLSQGGGIAVFDSAGSGAGALILVDSRIEYNQASTGGGIYVAVSGSSVSNTTFDSNLADFQGGGAAISAGLTIIGGSFLSNVARSGGAAILADTFYPVAIRSVLFQQNSVLAGDGAGIIVPAGRLALVNVSLSTFDTNVAGNGRGGAVFCGGGEMEFEGCDFTKNAADVKGGAVAVIGVESTGQGQTVVTRSSFLRCTFVGNQAQLGGGAFVVASTGELSVENSTISGSNSTSGGAILASDFASVSFVDSTCSNNTASFGGGCVSLTDFSRGSLSSSILDNNLGGSDGGAIRCSGQAALSAIGCQLSGNEAMGGGGLWVGMEATADVTDCQFGGNSAEFFGGAVYSVHSSNLNLTSSSFTSNSAELGGAVLSEGITLLSTSLSNFSSNSMHALVLRGSATATVAAAIFSNNSAPSASGGAVWTSDSATLVITKSQFLNNSADTGGAVSANGATSATAASCRFDGNVALLGGGALVGGDANFSVTGSSFVANRANLVGAGIVFEEGAGGGVASSTFSDNTAKEEGAALYVERLGQADTDVAGSSSGDGNGEGDGSGVVGKSGLMLPLTMSDLSFASSNVPLSQGSAYFDATSVPELRVNCTGCTRQTPSDTIGTLPVTFRMNWPGSNDTSSSWEIPFVVFGDVQQPIQNLSITLLDAFGSVAIKDFSSTAGISPDPRIKGLLRGSAQRGIIEMPPTFIVSDPETSKNFTVNVTVSSPTGAYPPIVRQMSIAYCPGGYFFSSETYSCQECSVGSWCAPGQGTQFCNEGTFSFHPGAPSPENCSTCPDQQTISGDGAVTCGNGVCEVAANYWLDPASLASEPSVYFCSVSVGCEGFEFENTSSPQCGEGYDETRSCAECSSDYYFLLKECYFCSSSKKNLFPLFVALLILCWVVLAVVSDYFDAVSMLIAELQVVCLLGTINLNNPSWVQTLIDISSITLLMPDITAFGCFFDGSSFIQSWSISVAIPFIGLALYMLLYFLLRFLRTKSSRQADSDDPTQGPPRTNIENMTFHGVANWVDLCYMPLTLRCLQAFYSKTYDVKVMGMAPPILWGSSSQKAAMVIAIILCAVYVLGVPVFFGWKMFQGKKKAKLRDHRYRAKWGWLVKRYETSYFWFHLTIFLRRILFAAIFVFGHEWPSIQLSLVFPLEILLIGLQFTTSPFTQSSHDYLASCLIIAQITFTIALTGLNYIGTSVDLSNFAYALSLLLFLLPTLIIFLYEVVEMIVKWNKARLMKAVWEREKNQANQLGASRPELGALKTFDSASTDASGGILNRLVHPHEVCAWFRPHVSALLLLPHREREHALLLRVAVLFSRTDPAIYGETLWTKNFKKSQLFAALHQVVLGSAAGLKPVVSVPKHAADVEAEAPGQGANLDADEAEHTRWISSKRTPSLKKLISKRVGSVSKEESEEMRKHAQALQRSGTDESKEGEALWPPDLHGCATWHAVSDKQSALMGRNQSMRSVSESGGQGPEAGGHRKVVSAIHGRKSSVGSLKKEETFDESDDDDDDDDEGDDLLESRDSISSGAGPVGGGGGGGGEFLEAWLDSTGLSLVFQHSFAELTRLEKKRKKTALRHLMTSEHINDILGWLSASTTQPEDRALFAELVHSVRMVVIEEAGSLSWTRCVIASLKKFMRPTKVESQAKGLDLYGDTEPEGNVYAKRQEADSHVLV